MAICSCEPGSVSSPPAVLEQNFYGISETRFSSAGCPSCQSTERNTKHWPQPVAWPQPFLLHHQTPDRRGTAPFTLALQRQYLS